MKWHLLLFVAFSVAIGPMVVAGATSTRGVSSSVTDDHATCPQECVCSRTPESKISGLKCTSTAASGKQGESWTACLRPPFHPAPDFFIHLTSISISDCSTLTNLTRSTFSASAAIVTLKLSRGNLGSLEAGALSNFGSTLHTLDLAHNRLALVPEGFFDDLATLRVLDLSGNQFVTFDLSSLNPGVVAFSLNESPSLERLITSNSRKSYRLESLSATNNLFLQEFCPEIIWQSRSLKSLDLRDSPQILLPHRAFKTNGERLKLSIDKVICDCSPPNDIVDDCQSSEGTSYLVDNFRRQFCHVLPEKNSSVTSADAESTLTLDCGATDNFERFIWITPVGEAVSAPSDTDCSHSDNALMTASCLQPLRRLFLGHNQATVLSNGSLVVENFGWSDRGIYECLAHDDLGRFQSLFTRVNLDNEYRKSLYNVSLIYGFVTAGGFLLLTLLFKLIHFLLLNYGCCLFCCCCKDQLPPKAKRLKTALESIEVYRAQQQEKLRENYALQNEWIRQNCAVQMERVRENYNWQVQNLRDIRQYGSCQVTAVRDQYYEQMSRIRDYSTGQMEKLHENYIFQRQRLRKFNAQNYLKMRETRQYTRRTLQKVMENLPVLYLDLTNCRQGLGDRQPSIEWDPTMDAAQILELEKLHQRRMQQLLQFGERRSDSLYFTPSGTPMREFPVDGSFQPSPSSSKMAPYNDSDAYRAVYQFSKTHGRVRSFSHFLPQLPGWFSTSAEAAAPAAAGGGPEVTKVVVERYNSNGDYFEVHQENETEHLLSSVIDPLTGEAKVEMTSSESSASLNRRQPGSSSECSSEKKPPSTSISSASNSLSKKTLITNLSSNSASELRIPIASQIIVRKTHKKRLSV